MSYSVSQPPASQKRPLQDHSNRPMYDSQKYNTQGLKPGTPAVAYCHPEQNQIHQGTQTFGFNQGSHYQYQHQNQYGHIVYPNVQNASLPYPPGYAFQNNIFLNAQGVHPQENGMFQGFHSQGLMTMNQNQQMQSNAMSRVSKVPELKSNEKWRTRHGKNDRNRIQAQHIGKSMFEAVSVSKHPFAIFAPYSFR